MKRKPDALLILALIFGLGVGISALTYSDGEPSPEPAASHHSAGVSR